MVRAFVAASLALAAASTVCADGLAVAYGVWLCDNKDPDLNTVRYSRKHNTSLAEFWHGLQLILYIFPQLPVEFRYSYPRSESSDWTPRRPVSDQGWNFGKLDYWTAGWRCVSSRRLCLVGLEAEDLWPTIAGSLETILLPSFSTSIETGRMPSTGHTHPTT